MTYANEMIGMRRWFIHAQTDTQLERAVENAKQKFGEDFWILLYGIDAYMELRKRKRLGWKL